MKKYLFIVILTLLISTGSLTNAQQFTFVNDLSVGTANPDVQFLQEWLISHGFDIPAISKGSASKGYFGAQTKAAVIRMQIAHGVPPTGYVGPLTRGRLNNNGNGNNDGKILVINGVTGPTSLSVNEQGKWQVSAKDPQDKGIWYSVNWGDGLYYGVDSCPRGYTCLPIANAINTTQQSPVFTHIYAKAGTYPISFAVSNSAGDRATYSTSITVNPGNTSGNLPPVISSVQAPTTLDINQTGNWTIKVSDPENGYMTYLIDWGDNLTPVNLVECLPGYACQPRSTASITQGSTFTHSYAQAGTYTVKITVKDTAGLSAQSSATVVVGGSVTNTPRVVSPNGSETWVANTNQVIRWTPSEPAIAGEKIDIHLYDDVNCSTGCTVAPKSYILDKNISAASGAYGWIVATDINDVHIPGGSYKVRICQSAAPGRCDSSDNFFTIVGNAVTNLSLLSPSWNDSWKLGTAQTILWTSPVYIRATYADIKIKSYYDPSSCPSGYACMPPLLGVYTIASNVSINQNYFTWTVGNFNSVNPNQFTSMAAGKYTAEICETGTTNCVTSAPFTITN